MKQYLSIVIVTVICIICVVLAVFWRTSHKQESVSINDLPHVEPSNVLIYDDSVTVYDDVK